ncbi:MAG TPA: ATP-binding protein, partial [Gaiellaceae bacterium]|nr:ATP-binding protein [Gaiellaceae bacterium]
RVDGTIVKANRTLLEWTQRAAGDLVGRMRLNDLLAPGARIYLETHVLPLLHMQDTVREVATEIVRGDGARIPVLMNMVLVRDAEGAPRVVRTTFFDASDRRRYERELLRARSDAESRARAAVALEHVAEGVVLVGERGEVELLNPAAESILGLTAATAVGRRLTDLVAGWDTIAARVSPARRGELPAPEVLPLAVAGRDRWLAVAALDAADATVYTFRDVTADRDLDQLRSDMVAIVSHELRTPLTGAYGAAQTLLARFDTLSEDSRHMLLKMIVEQSEQLSRILDRILLANALDSNNVHPDMGVFEAQSVVDSVLQNISPGERSRVIVKADQRIRVRGDLDRLRQVVANLLDNALKYSAGPVRLCVDEHGASARFTVADDGPGVPPEEADRIFEKFYRLDPAQRSGVGGTGLGLYVSRELVRRMGGRIGYLQRDRRGATFFVDLALER